MTMMIEIDSRTNEIAFASYRIVLGELMASRDQISGQLRMATATKGASEMVEHLSLLSLQCLFGLRLLCLRAACYERSMSDPEYSKQFWLEVTFN